MRLLDVQPKKSFSYIFVQFPGMKMNVPFANDEEGKVVREDVALCVQLNSKEKVNGLYLVRTGSIRPFDFTEEGMGAKAFYRVIRKKESSLNSPAGGSHDIVSFITDEVSVVQKKTETGYSFLLILNGREIGVVASIEENAVQTVSLSLQHTAEEEKEPAAVASISKQSQSVPGRSAEKTIFSGGYVFEVNGVFEPIRILLEGAKRKVALFSPAALDFIGPGDYGKAHFLLRGG